MKKNIYLIISIFLCYACSNTQAYKKDTVAQEMSILNDSILNLTLEFNRTNDTTLAEKALLVSDRMLKFDTNEEYEFRNLYQRAQVLYCLGRYKENFELMGQILTKYGSDIDRMIHKGVEYQMKGKNDSTQYYLDLALEQCNNLIADSTDIVYKIAEIYIIMGKKSEIKKIIEELSIKYPKKVHDLNLALKETDIIEENLSLLFEAYSNNAGE